MYHGGWEIVAAQPNGWSPAAACSSSAIHHFSHLSELNIYERRDDRFPVIIYGVKFSGIFKIGGNCDFWVEFFQRLINWKSKKVRLRNKLRRFRVSILVHNLAGGLRLTLDALARQNAHQLHARMSHNVKKNFAKFPKNLSWTRLHTQRNFINDF